MKCHLIDWIKGVCTRNYKTENRKLRAQLVACHEVFDLERDVLVQEIARGKHMVSVYQKLFSNLDLFNRSFTIVQLSLQSMTDTVVHEKYASIANIEMLKIEHLMFKLEVYRLFVHIDRHQIQEIEPIIQYTECAIGRWYYGDGYTKFKDYIEFLSIEEPHRLMHVYAAEALELFISKNYLEGIDRITKMETESIHVLSYLDALSKRLVVENTALK